MCREEPQTVENWLQRCPNAVAPRQQLFGEQSPPLSVPTSKPGSIRVLAKNPSLRAMAPCLKNNNNNGNKGCKGDRISDHTGNDRDNRRISPANGTAHNTEDGRAWLNYLAND